MLYLSHAYDGASENENEEAKDHHKVLRRNNGHFQSSKSKGPPQRTVEKEGHFPSSKFSLRNGFPHKPRKNFGKTRIF